MALTIFDTKTMLEMIEVDQQPTTFLLDTFFPTSRVFGSVAVEFDLRKKSRNVAAYVSRKAEGENVGLTKFKTLRYEPPYLKPKKTITVADLLKKNPGEIEWVTGLSKIERAGQKIQEEFDELDDRIWRAEELQASQALRLGKVTPLDKDGNLVGDEIDFDRDPNLTKALVSPPWEGGAADILADLRAFKREVFLASGVMPTKAVFGSEAIDAMLKDDEVQAYLDNRRIDSGSSIVMRAQALGATFVGNIEGLDIFGYDGTFLDIDGTTVLNYIDPKEIVIGTDQTNERLYGVLEWMEDETERLFASPRLPVSWTEKDPAARFLQVHSAPIVVTKNPDVNMKVIVISP